MREHLGLAGWPWAALMSRLNENHRRVLQVACRCIDEQLSRVEAMLESSATAAFPRTVNDLMLAQKRVVRDYIAHIRQQLLAFLSAFGLAPEPPGPPVQR